MRKLALLASLALLAAGCGGSSAKGPSHTVIEVSKAFYDAGLPFTNEQTFNPYVNGQVVYLPGKLNTSPLRSTVLAQLTFTTQQFSGVSAWVFDSDADAAQALKAIPIDKWLTNRTHVVTAHNGNVIVVAVGFIGDQRKKLDAAIAALTH